MWRRAEPTATVIQVRYQKPLGFQVPSKSSVASGQERDGHKLDGIIKVLHNVLARGFLQVYNTTIDTEST